MENRELQTHVTAVGSEASLFWEQGMLVFFGCKAQSDLAQYSILIDDFDCDCDFVRGDAVKLGDGLYRITAVGEVANRNLQALGHVVIKFDGKDLPELPGTMHVEQQAMPQIEAGMPVAFLKQSRGGI